MDATNTQASNPEIKALENKAAALLSTDSTTGNPQNTEKGQASPASNPSTGANNAPTPPKKKRGRPSKADIAARQAAQSGANAPTTGQLAAAAADAGVEAAKRQAEKMAAQASKLADAKAISQQFAGSIGAAFGLYSKDLEFTPAEIDAWANAAAPVVVKKWDAITPEQALMAATAALLVPRVAAIAAQEWAKFDAKRKSPPTMGG